MRLAARERTGRSCQCRGLLSPYEGAAKNAVPIVEDGEKGIATKIWITGVGRVTRASIATTCDRGSEGSNLLPSSGESGLVWAHASGE